MTGAPPDISESTDLAVHCRGITKSYGTGDAKVTALRGLDIDVRRGELLMIVGPSGCGKTTLISIIAAILNQDSGRCEVVGHDLQRMDHGERARFRGSSIGFLLLLAVVGLTVAVGAIIRGNETPAIALPPVQAAKVPFASYVAGAGIIEASTENIAIGTPVAGIVTAIYVKWNDGVNAGDPLFKIDDRDMQGQLLLATAKVKEAEANLAKANYLLKLGEGLSVGSSISALDKENRRFDVAIKEAGLASATAQVEQIKIEIERRTIRAPVTGRILQIKTRLGEFAQSGALTTPLMLLGDDSRLHLRVDIDENDAWRVQSGANATAFVRSNPTLETPLKFERFEPYVVPKVSLTGQSTERTDTRVLQVIYSFDPAALPVYVGQQMDAYIEAPPVAGPNAPAQRSSGNIPYDRAGVASKPQSRAGKL